MAQFTERDIRIGSKVIVRQWSGESNAVTVEGFGEKNDRPLIDYTLAGDGRWAYISQIERVISK